MANDQPHDIQSVTEKNNDELKSNLQTIDNNSKSPDINREDHKDETSANTSESTQPNNVQIGGTSAQKPSLTKNDSDNNRQRTLSSSSSASSSSSSSDNQTSNIPYEILNNDEDDDDDDHHPSN